MNRARCQISEQWSRNAKVDAKSSRFLTTVRRFQLARRARHHLPIVLIVRSIRTALSLAKSRYENYVASDGLHPCRPPHTYNRYACVVRNAILLPSGRFSITLSDAQTLPTTSHRVKNFNTHTYVHTRDYINRFFFVCQG